MKVFDKMECNATIFSDDGEGGNEMDKVSLIREAAELLFVLSLLVMLYLMFAPRFMRWIVGHLWADKDNPPSA